MGEIEITDAAGRVVARTSPALLKLASAAAERVGSARFYAAELYMDRPRTRAEWRAWFDARHAMRAEIRFRPFFL